MIWFEIDDWKNELYLDQMRYPKFSANLILPVITIIPAMEHNITIATVLSVSVKRYPIVWYVLTVDGIRVVYIEE